MVKTAKAMIKKMTMWARAGFERLKHHPHKRLILVIITVYLSGYVYLRSHHLMVHAMGYGVTDQGRIVLQHQIRPGDFGVPIFNLGLNLFIRASYWGYLPVRPIETLAWSIIHPRATVLPHTPRSLSDLAHQKNQQAVRDAFQKIKGLF